MENFERPGEVQTFVAPVGGVVSGGVYQIGQALAVAQGDADAGDNFEGKVRGVFTVTKAPSQAWTQGALVYWDAGNGYFTTTASGNRLAGYATEDAASGAALTTGHVYLDGTARADNA